MSGDDKRRKSSEDILISCECCWSSQIQRVEGIVLVVVERPSHSEEWGFPFLTFTISLGTTSFKEIRTLMLQGQESLSKVLLAPEYHIILWHGDLGPYKYSLEH